MNSILDKLGPGLTVVLLVLIASVIVLSVMVAILYNKMKEFSGAYKRTFRKGRAKNLEDLINENLDIVDNASALSEEVTKKMEEVEAKMARCIQNVGMVRYRAFQDMGPELSFSVALLDANRDGLILTNIFGGSNCSVYSKPVVDGKSDFILSLEEKEALEIAMSDKVGKVPGPVKKPSIPSLIASVIANNVLAKN